MCGIAGIVAPDARRYERHLQRMVAALRHRGPDGEGVHFAEGCALGHCRLSVVDLETGRQPMLSRDSAAAITFNGEIYGYKGIRDRLADYPFRTQSDTEVILALYERHGPMLLAGLPGMFAFGIWDAAQQRLFCARDRFGEKPLFYAFGSGGELCFASEIKGLLASGLIRPVLDRGALAHYIKYLYVRQDETIYRNVYVLPPGHSLQYWKGRLTVERYWSLPQQSPGLDVQEAIAEFRRLVRQAVQGCLVADVPVGAFLSGGLDSSTIVAEASRECRSLDTFSFGFEDAAKDLPFAREVAEQYRTRHQELADRHVDIADLLVEMQRVFDEPFADSSNIPMWLLSKLARRHVKVVLTGDGADELLGGYSFWYRPLWHMAEAPRTMDHALPLMRALWRVGRRLGLPVGESWHHRIKGLELRRAWPSLLDAHRAQKQYCSDDDLVRFGIGSAGSRLAERPLSGAGLDDVLREDVLTYMPGDILVKLDRSSMAHGLELRAPFLDVPLASFCLSLPLCLKIDRDTDKVILRRAFAEAWPASVRTRGKQGFGGPVGSWLKKPAVAELKRTRLDDPNNKLFSVLSFSDTRAAAGRDDYLTWVLLVLSLWMEGREMDIPSEGAHA